MCVSLILRLLSDKKIAYSLVHTVFCDLSACIISWHNVHRQQRQLSKFLMRYQQFASRTYCGAVGPVSKMASQYEKAFCVLRFEVSRSVITVQREFRARFRKDAPCMVLSVYCAVRPGSLNKAVCVSSLKGQCFRLCAKNTVLFLPSKYIISSHVCLSCTFIIHGRIG